MAKQGKRVPQSLHDKARDLLASGLSPQKVAESLGVSRYAVRAMVKRNFVARPMSVPDAMDEILRDGPRDWSTVRRLAERLRGKAVTDHQLRAAVSNNLRFERVDGDRISLNIDGVADA